MVHSDLHADLLPDLPFPDFVDIAAHVGDEDGQVYAYDHGHKERYGAGAHEPGNPREGTRPGTALRFQSDVSFVWHKRPL